MTDHQYIRRLDEVGINDVAIVGGKNASLGELRRELLGAGVTVPDGFVTTAHAFREFLVFNELHEPIAEALAGLDVTDVVALARCGASLRHSIAGGELPPPLEQELRCGYADLAQRYGPDPDVAIRSSATAEDLPTASFAGQQDTYLNVSGVDALLETVKLVFASLFTDRAIAYRVHKGFAHADVALSVAVQKMVRADRAVSGVMFTLDTESGFRDVVLVAAAYGLGENIVQGTVNPDEFLVFKPNLGQGYTPIIRRQLGDKATKRVCTESTSGSKTEDVPVAAIDRERFALSDDEVLELAAQAVAIEKHYSAKAGHAQPMDIEWAKDADSGELFIVQARPETIHTVRDQLVSETYTLSQRGKTLLHGKSVGTKIASGRARVILDVADMQALQPGEILVTDITNPDWEPVLARAGAIVTNRGGRVCHAAIVARELGKPAVVATANATEVLENGMEVTVCCAEGDVGRVYAGLLPFHKESIDVSVFDAPRTDVMLIVGDPSQAFDFAALPNRGVGLVRLEFIIGHHIGIHPGAVLQYSTLPVALREQIDARTHGYADGVQFYVNRLAEGVGTIAAAFYPKRVIVRLSDFKSNEYAGLLGGERFEPKEENPMIGFRGASRYYAKQFADCFALECQAMKQVRETMGLSNVELMLPFVRTVTEQQKVLALMADNGLRRGVDELKVHVMCEIPANALRAHEFLAHCDGFSIGSNDLTQLTLGADRDSDLLVDFDEREGAVLDLMAMAIEACHRDGKYIGICGQAPSDFPFITRWLVERGIDSIALNPDSVMRMSEVIRSVESDLATQAHQPTSPVGVE